MQGEHKAAAQSNGTKQQHKLVHQTLLRNLDMLHAYPMMLPALA
jgi:hypothetical protein